MIRTYAISLAGITYQSEKRSKGKFNVQMLYKEARPQFIFVTLRKLRPLLFAKLLKNCTYRNIVTMTETTNRLPKALL